MESPATSDVTVTGGATAEITLTNAYEGIPEPPKTGDDSMPLVYLALLAQSLGSLLVLRKRFVR